MVNGTGVYRKLECLGPRGVTIIADSRDYLEDGVRAAGPGTDLQAEDDEVGSRDVEDGGLGAELHHICTRLRLHRDETQGRGSARRQADVERGFWCSI